MTPPQRDDRGVIPESSGIQFVAVGGARLEYLDINCRPPRAAAHARGPGFGLDVARVPRGARRRHRLPDHRLLAPRVRPLLATRRSYDIAGIRCPVLAILGEDDPYSSVAQVEALAANAPSEANVRILRIARCGHAPHREKPEVVVPAIAGMAG